MNTFKKLLTLTLLCGLMYSCQELVPCPPCPEVPTPTYRPMSQTTFNEYKTRWDATYRNYFASDSLHYFDMPLGDLTAILNENPVDSARFYLGMDSDTIPHLMLVGTNNGVPSFNIIADYSHACPPKC